MDTGQRRLADKVSIAYQGQRALSRPQFEMDCAPMSYRHDVGQHCSFNPPKMLEVRTLALVQKGRQPASDIPRDHHTMASVTKEDFVAKLARPARAGNDQRHAVPVIFHKKPVIAQVSWRIAKAATQDIT